MSRLLVVLGITGIQGGSVATHFSTISGWKIRGITRNTTSKSALAWVEKGIELVQANVNDTSSLVSSFEGANAIFVTTNFFDSLYNPGTQSLLSPGQTVNEYCYELELQQVKNVTDAAAQTEGLERLVVSTLADADKWSQGKYKWVYHFDSKARGLDYLKAKYPELMGKTSAIHMAPYMSNWKENLHFRKAEDGTIRLTTLQGTQTTARPLIDAERDTGALVHAALEASPGKTIMGSIANQSWMEQFKTWCKILDLEYGGFDELTIEQFESSFPVPGLGKELGEMFLFIDEYGLTGGEGNIVFPEELGVSSALTSWEDYVKKEDWSKVLASLK